MSDKLNNYGKQFIDKDDELSVIEALYSPMLTTGEFHAKFENEIKKLIGNDFVITNSNGTTALLVAYLGLGLQENDLVICPTITFMATANAVKQFGGQVFFSDVCPKTSLMRPIDLENAIKQCLSQNLTPKAVSVVHMHGRPCDMAGIKKVADQYNLLVIEDAAHAFGTNYINNGQSYITGACDFSDAATFSYHPVKNITTAEGGATTFKKQEHYNIGKKLIAHGITRTDFKNTDLAIDPATGEINAWYHEMDILGYNFRLTDLQSALGLSQLRKMQMFKEKRKSLLNKYIELTKDIDGIEICADDDNNDTFYHLGVFLIDFEKFNLTRHQLMMALREQQIGTQVHYIPVHRQPYWQQHKLNTNDIDQQFFAGAYEYYSKCLAFPLFPLMEINDCDIVINKLKSILKIK